MTTIYEIEKNIPITPDKRGGLPIYPLRAMNIDDSFLVETDSKIEMRVMRNKLACAVSYFGKRNNRKYTIRYEDEYNMRVWRIK